MGFESAESESGFVLGPMPGINGADWFVRAWYGMVW